MADPQKTSTSSPSVKQLTGSFLQESASDIDAFQDTVSRHKKNFIARIIDYYGRSNVDRTFEKKLDWSIAPGPNYSSDVGFGIGFLIAGRSSITNRWWIRCSRSRAGGSAGRRRLTTV